MWPRKRKQHLRYSSPRAWEIAQGLDGIAQIQDSDESDRKMDEWLELRAFLFAKHLKTLSKSERRAFRRGTHPSQSWAFESEAESFAPALQQHLANRGHPAAVSLGHYHGDRLVLSADLKGPPGADEPHLPWLFRGFEVLYGWPQMIEDPSA